MRQNRVGHVKMPFSIPQYYPFCKDEEEYKDFIRDVTDNKEEGIPIVIEYNSPEDIVYVNDIRPFSKKFREDTGLNIIFSFFICENCDRLHCVMQIDD